MSKCIILTGKQFGRLTVVERGENNSTNHVRWICRCVCGNIRLVNGWDLKSGKTTSCGCLRSERVSEAQTTHGHSCGYRKTPTYSTWKALRKRCNNPNSKDYPRYGGRGITICKRWEKFENFLVDLGEKPKGTSIDRINNNGNYESCNCRWADSKTQSINKTQVNRYTKK